MLLTRKLLNQGFLLVKLKPPLRKCSSRPYDLVDCYGIYVSFFCPFVHFLLTIVLSVLLRYTVSDYPLVSSNYSSKSRKHFPFLSSLMTYHRVCTWNNKTGATSLAGTAYQSGSPELAPVFYLH